MDTYQIAEAQAAEARRQIGNKMPLTLGGNGQFDVIAAGPMSIQPMSNPVRITLVRVRDEEADPRRIFHLRHQYFPEARSGDLETTHFGSNLGIFGAHQIAEAVQAFGERVAREAGSIGSLLRDEPA